MKNLKNIDIQILPKDWVYGANSPLQSNLINPDFWERYLPIVEFQQINGVETWGCLSYSALNCVETLQIHLTGIEENYNDQFINILSGTTIGGNSAQNVWDTIEERGLIRQDHLIFTGGTWDEYINQEITQEMLDEGLEWKEKWQVYRDFIPTDPKIIYEMLGNAPLQAFVRYANSSSREEILNPTGKPNHAVMMFNAKYGDWFEIYEHYNQIIKRYDWNYKFPAIIRPTLIIKNKIMFTPKENELYLLVEGKEQKLGMGLGGKLVIYDEKIDTLLNSTSRSKKYQIPIPLTLEQWNNCEQINGKGEKI